MKRRAEQATGREFRHVVHGRPVHFVDNAPEADRKAEETLRAIAREIGFDEVTFQFEPIAAALDYERQIAAEEIALIADIGGGTSDFSIVRLGPRVTARPIAPADILANDGVRIGGTDFDRQLSLGVVMPLLGFGSAMKRAGLDVPSSYFHDLATWSNINRHVRAARARRYPPGAPARPASRNCSTGCCGCWTSSAAIRWRWMSRTPRSRCRRSAGRISRWTGSSRA